MEMVEGDSSARGRYTLKPTRINNEDILFCIDVDGESLLEMKSTGAGGRPLTRLESIKQAILVFINTKLSINPDHRFAFATLTKSASWVGPPLSLSQYEICKLNLDVCYPKLGLTKRSNRALC